MTKHLTAICALVFIVLSILLFNCTKKDSGRNAENYQKSQTNTLSSLDFEQKGAKKTRRSHPKEGPINETKKEGDNQITSSSTSLTSEGCNNTFYGEYLGSGSFIYPMQTLNFSSIIYESIHAKVIFSAWQTPNKFTITDPSGNIVAATGWIGYSETSGPWGASLNESSDVEISFLAKKLNGYTLHVETYTTNLYDYYEVQITCIPPSADINDFKNSPRYSSLFNFASNFGTVQTDNGTVVYFEDDPLKPWINIPVVNSSNQTVGLLKVVKIAPDKVASFGNDYAASFVRFEDGYSEISNTGIVSFYDLDDQNQMIGRWRIVNGITTEDLMVTTSSGMMSTQAAHYCDKNKNGDVTFSECMNCMVGACQSDSECWTQCITYTRWGGACMRAFRVSCAVISIFY